VPQEYMDLGELVAHVGATRSIACSLSTRGRTSLEALPGLTAAMLWISTHPSQRVSLGVSSPWSPASEDSEPPAAPALPPSLRGRAKARLVMRSHFTIKLWLPVMACTTHNNESWVNEDCTLVLRVKSSTSPLACEHDGTASAHAMSGLLPAHPQPSEQFLASSFATHP